MSDVTRVCDMLDAHYGEKKWRGPKPLIDELILTILSQNTTAKNCNEAFARLRGRFCLWERVMEAPVEEVVDAIRVGGLANRKAPRIKRILEEIAQRHGNLDIQWLSEKPDAEALEYLVGFDGVGRKTAACVLMFGLDRPVMPVDTHVRRVASRLGLIENIGAHRAHDLLQSIVPPARIYSCHLNMVAHGREICRAGRPNCEICPLKEECDFFAREARSGG